jgi:hypothetical protein
MRLSPKWGWFAAFTAVFAVCAAVVFWGTWSPEMAPVIYAGRVEKVRIVENRRDQARLNRVSIAFERRRDHDRAADRAKSRFEKITAARGREPAKTSNC